MSRSALRALKVRTLQVLALYSPGATTLRVRLHRWRGVEVGDGVFIGTDALLETAYPELISIGNGVAIGIRSTLIAHFRGAPSTTSHGTGPVSIRIGNDAFIGPGAIVLPNVTIGHGAVVTAGSVVTRSVPPLTMVQGNPAIPVAKCGIPLGLDTPLHEFYRQLKPIRNTAAD